MIRLYVEGSEPRTRSEGERKALLNHRLDSISYWQDKLTSGDLSYAFRSRGGKNYHILVRANSLEDADALLKSDPAWFFSNHSIAPVTTTKSMLSEIFSNVPLERFASLGINPEQHAFSDDEMAALDNDQRPIDPDGMYTLAAKALAAMSATTPVADQDSIWAKTIASQRVHLNDVELVDHNPVGRAAGILIGKGSPKELAIHVSQAPIYPHTVVKYTRLMTLKQAWARTSADLASMGEQVRAAPEF